MSYRTYTCDELQSAARKLGDVAVKETGTGHALFTTYGARLLGLFPAAGLHNVLWVSKALDKMHAANDWLIGGERLWIAPERNFFYENPRDFEGFHVPAGLDPGAYEKEAGLTFQNMFALLDLTNNNLYENTTMLRTFKPMADPYKTRLAFAGIRIADSVSVPGRGCTFAAWSVTQVYTAGAKRPGTALLPVKKGGGYISYFAPPAAARAKVEEGYVRFKHDSCSVGKVGIAPEQLDAANPAKAVYVSPFSSGDQWFCVVKRSLDLPKSQAECVDFPKLNPEGDKGAVQSYNNGPGFRKGDDSEFGEIELQFVKATSAGKATVSRAEHEVLSYAGSKDQILELAQTVLKLKAKPRVY